MSYLDPYGGNAEPRGWQRADQPRGPERPDGAPGRQWSDSGDDTGVRIRQADAVPDTHAEPDAYDAARAHPEGGPPAERNGHLGRDEPYPLTDLSAHPAADDAFPYPDGVESPGVAGAAAAPTDPVGWPLVEPGAASGSSPTDPAGWPLVEPQATASASPPTAPVSWPRVDPRSPPVRRGPGRRRADRAGKPIRPSRAGRNLPAAIGVGLALGAAILVPLFLYLPAFLAVVAVAVSVGIWEMARAVASSGVHPPLVPLIGGGLLMVGLAWWAGPDALSLALLVTVLATMVWRLGDGPAGYQRDLSAAVLIAVYVPFLGGFAALLAASPGDGQFRVLVTLAAVVLSDTGGYAAGVAFGKHPMAPSVSPKKSWEGFAGSVLAAAVGSAVLLGLLLDIAPWWGALFGVAVSGAAVLGDLGESMIKRDLRIKDMSSLLPGHGGLMDRLDSVLFAVPTAYLLLAIFAPPG